MKESLTINNKLYQPIDYYLNKIDFSYLYNNTISTIEWHGDMQFDNIIKTPQGFKFIDWRDNFGDSVDYGDAYYDLAKLYGGIHMNYSYMKDESNYSYSQKDNIVNFKFKSDDDKEILIRGFKNMVSNHNFSFKKIQILTSLIYLNMAPLHEKGLDHLLFSNAITFLDELDD
jgi:thiamine kinase-like enzyme